MATDGSADRTRHPRHDLEEGEFVAGSDTDDDTRRYVLQHHRRHGLYEEGRPEIKRQRLERFPVDGGALPSPTPSYECDSDGTISDIDADAAAALAPRETMSFPCPVCRRGFKNEKARCGHMRVHDPRGRQQGSKERPPALVPPICGGWAVTGKRGSVGGRSVSLESLRTASSMAIVVAQPVVMDPIPVAFASRSSSAEPSPPHGDDSMAIVVASSHGPPNQIAVHPPCSPQSVTDHQPAAAPQPAVAPAQGQPLAQPGLQLAVHQVQPAVAQGQPLAQPARPQFLPGLQLAVHQSQRAVPQPPARDEHGWWLCKEKGCDQRYATHQGLGGHMAGHKNRQNSEATAAGLHLGLGDAACGKPAKLHHCKHCPKVFPTGVQLGGHMRKHYDGKVIPKKRSAGAKPMVSASALATALALPPLPTPPAAMEVAQPAAAPVAAVAPAVPGVLRLFGVNIVPAVPPAAAASAVTQTDQSSAASTNIIQEEQYR